MSNRTGTESKTSTSPTQNPAPANEDYCVQAPAHGLISTERKHKINESTDDPDNFYNLGKIYQARLLAEFKQTNTKPAKDNPTLRKTEDCFMRAGAKGQCALGLLYLQGELIDKDAAEALQVFARATIGGSAEAAYHLAYCYEHGEGLPQVEIELAAETYEFAAQQDEPHALKRLGDCYRLGQLGFAQEPEQADTYYLRAARGGNKAAIEQVVDTYIQRGDIMPVLDVFKKANKLGYQPAQQPLRDYYEHSRDYQALYSEYVREGDNERAYYYQGLAALQPGGNKRELETLGAIYFAGDDVAQDFKKAGKFLEVVYRQDELKRPKNKTRLAYCYENGLGVEKDLKEAFKLYQSAAEQGEVKAKIHVANCYEKGLGVEKDLKEAFKLYQSTAEQGNAKAKIHVANCYEKGLGVEKDLKEAFKLYQSTAEQGNAKAKIHVANCYEKGLGVEKDLKEAFKLYQSAAEQGNAKAKIHVANCYEKGLGVKKDLKEAFKHYESAAEQGDAKAKIHVANCYLNGRGVVQDKKAAVQGLKKLVDDKNEPEAQYHLGFCYFHGTGVTQSYEEAIKYFKRSARAGYKEGVYQVAACYQHGYGVKPSEDNVELLVKSLEEKSSIDITALLSESAPSVTTTTSGFYYHPPTPEPPPAQDVSTVPSSLPTTRLENV